MAMDFSFPKDASGNAGFLIPSAINLNAFSKYLVRELTYPPPAPSLTSAPIRSTSSSNLSLGIEVVPSPSICPISSTKPAFLPSRMGPASILIDAVTLGNLWFSTTNIVMPLASVNTTGSFIEITGAGPADGFFDLSIFICAKPCCNKTTLNATIINFFIYGIFSV